LTAPTVESLSHSLPEPSVRLKLKARKGWQAIDFAELWHYRELLWILAQRDVKVRYKQSVLGVLWAIIPPLFNMVIFTIIFTVLLKIQAKDISNGIPYAIFSFTGMVPWALFANSLSNMGNSMVGSQQLITKVYFPRLVIPLSSILSCLLDFAIAMVILAGMMVYYHNSIHIGWPLLALPFFTLLAILSAMSVGIWLAALNVEYRDIRFVIPVMIQLWMYASPVIYSSNRVPPAWQFAYALNPMVGVLEGFRWSLLGVGNAPGWMLALSVVVVTALMVGGLFYFRRTERTFADLV
jgi:lipopolysaccharide transport system permease protein